MTSESGDEVIARRFVEARAAGAALGDYPGEMPATLDQAYGIQGAAIALHGGAIAGWKVGRIMSPLSERFGAERLAGPIFTTDVQPASDDVVGRVFADGFGAAEAEFLLRIGTAPAAGKTAFTLEEAADLVDAVHIGIEIASSPYPGINDHGPAITVSDFGNNNGLIVGPAIPDWRDSGFADVEVALTIGTAGQSTGRASAFPDGPLGSVRFLLGNLAARGIAVEPGTWVSSGAITGVHRVRPGDDVVADFGRFGTVTCRIEG